MSIKYKISLSNKVTVYTDEDGYVKLLENISSNFVILNGEVVNPSFIVSITKELDWGTNEPSLYVPTPNMRLKGHIDEKTRKYVIDGEEPITPTVY